MHYALALYDIWSQIVPYIAPTDLFNVVLTNHLFYELTIDGLWGHRQLLSSYINLIGIRPVRIGLLSSRGMPRYQRLFESFLILINPCSRILDTGK